MAQVLLWKTRERMKRPSFLAPTPCLLSDNAPSVLEGAHTACRQLRLEQSTVPGGTALHEGKAGESRPVRAYNHPEEWEHLGWDQPVRRRKKKKAVLKRYLTCRVLACHAGHVPAFGLGLPLALRGRHARVSPGSATSMVPALRAEGTREWGQPPAWGAAGAAPRPWGTKKAGMDAASTSPLIFLNERVAQLPPLPVQSQIPEGAPHRPPQFRSGTAAAPLLVTVRSAPARRVVRPAASLPPPPAPRSG